MFSNNKDNKTSSPKKAFTFVLIVVLVGAIWVLAQQKNTWKNVVASFQRSVTTETQLEHQCRDLQTDEGQQRCQEALEKVESTLETFQTRLQEAQE